MASRTTRCCIRCSRQPTRPGRRSGRPRPRAASFRLLPLPATFTCVAFATRFLSAAAVVDEPEANAALNPIEPLQIADVDALKAREADRGYVIPTEMEIGIEEGRKVRVMAGPLKDMEGVFRGYLRGGQRARVLMEFLRRRSLVEVETELLAVVRA